MFDSKSKSVLILIAILLLAASLRLYHLGHIPISLFGDEIDAGYNAYSFLKTGKDYNGNFLPLNFESMGDYRPFGFIIALIPSIAVFGLSDFSVRLTPALMGLLGVWFIYLFVKQNLKLSIALISALLLAIMPWHIHYSRFALEETYMSALLLLSSYLFIKGLTQPRYLLLAAFLFAYNSYSYNIAKLFSPLLLVVFLVVYQRQVRKIPAKYLATGLIIFSLTLAPLIYDSLLGQGQTRFNSLNILNTPDLVSQINYSRGQLPDWPPFLAKLFNNKLVSLTKIFFNNYLSSYDPRYLYVTGQADEPRHSLPGFGLLFVWLFPFTILGLHQLFNKLNHQFNQLILVWLLIAPLPAALTISGGQHASRTFVLLPPIIIITAIGLHFSFQKIRPQLPRLIFLIAVSCLASVNLIYYLQTYYFHYSQTYYRSWQYGLEPALNYAFDHQDQYDHIIVTTNYVNLPMLYYIFYTQYPPQLLHQQFLSSQANQAPSPTSQIGKYQFAAYSPRDVTQPPNSLYIAVPQEYNPVWHIVGQLNAPDPNEDKPLLLYLSSK